MASRLTAALREAPATVPALAALALMVAWATSDAGYPLTHWAPGGLIVLALLATALIAVRPRVGAIPIAVRIAVLCLAAYTALSFFSILWAAVPGDAWEGANRTLLYLLVFALFACWRQRGASAALLLCAWTLALIGLAAFALLHVNAAAHSAARLAALLPEGRLVYPAGYVNANAAQWLMAFWPALLLARARELPAALRGALAGGAVLLAEIALLSQSRGALYSTPVMLALVFALLPARVRTFAVLAPVAAGIAAAVPAVLRVAERVEAAQAASTATAPTAHGGTVAAAHGRTVAAAHGGVAAAAQSAAGAAIHGATLAVFAAALAVGLAVAAGAAVERRRGPLPRAAATRVHRGVGALALVCLLAVLAAGWAVAGNPVTRARHAWDTFKSPGGYAADSHTGSRLTSGLGSARYDFYRVALDEFAAHPLLGIGADNFAEPYLARGRSAETPHYPHSVELRALTETGLLGALLALAGLAAALVACWQATRRSADRLARAVAAAALAGFGYWLVHGSFDWFWEFAGLGAPAFALLGLACALAPRRGPARSSEGTALSPGVEPAGSSGFGVALSPRGPAARAPARGRARARGGALAFVLAIALLALAAILSLSAPWLGALQTQNAARIWVRDPSAAYARLDDAARLNPLSDEPYVLAGSIALRLDELARADRDFALALARTPGDAYAALERGAIASARGQRRAAVVLLARAARLDPRDPLTRQALALARNGRRIDIAALNSSILASARQF
jgi:O-Antigen ligase